MPTQKVSFDKLAGLNRDSSPQLLEPNTMDDCMNVTFPEEGVLQARHGHPTLRYCLDLGGNRVDFYNKTETTSREYFAASDPGGVAGMAYGTRQKLAYIVAPGTGSLRHGLAENGTDFTPQWEFFSDGGGNVGVSFWGKFAVWQGGVEYNYNLNQNTKTILVPSTGSTTSGMGADNPDVRIRVVSWHNGGLVIRNGSESPTPVPLLCVINHKDDVISVRPYQTQIYREHTSSAFVVYPYSYNDDTNQLSSYSQTYDNKGPIYTNPAVTVVGEGPSSATVLADTNRNYLIMNDNDADGDFLPAATVTPYTTPTVGIGYVGALGFKSDANSWMLGGQEIKVRAVIKYITEDGREMYGPPSPPYRYRQLVKKSPMDIHAAFVIKTQLKTTDTCKVVLEIHRTKSYAAGSIEELRYYKAAEFKITTGTEPAQRFIDAYTYLRVYKLNLNDAALVGSPEELYTNGNLEGDTSSSICPPTALTKLNYKGYTVFGNVYQPYFGSFNVLNAAITSEMYPKVGSVRFPVYPFNPQTPLTNASVMDEGSLGISSSLTTSSCEVSLNGNMEDTGRMWLEAPATVNGTNVTLNVRGNSGYARTLPDVGTLAFVLRNTDATDTDASQGVLIDLITYKGYTVTVAADGVTDNITLSNAIRKNSNSVITQPASGIYAFSLESGSIEGQSVYWVGVRDGGSLAASVLPLRPPFHNKQPLEFSAPVGYISAATVAGTRLTLTVVLTAPLFSDATDKIKRWTNSYANMYNICRKITQPFAIIPEANTGRVILVGDRSHPSLDVPYGAPVGVDVGGFTMDALSGSDRITLNLDRHVIAGLTVSRYYAPVDVPLSQIQAPVLVGDKTKPIMALAENNDNLYILKGDGDGIYRVVIRSGARLPVISDASILVDNTHWCVAGNSVQSMENMLFFLSQRGVVAIDAAERVININEPVENDFKRLIEQVSMFGEGVTKQLRLAKISSFVVPTRRIYGICFPVIPDHPNGITYVFDASTGNWSKWDFIADFSYFKNGKLESYLAIKYLDLPAGESTLAAIKTAPYTTTAVMVNRADSFTTGDNDAVDQFDEQWALNEAPSAVSTNLYSCRPVATTAYAATHTISALYRKTWLLKQLRDRRFWLKQGSNVWPVTIVSADTLLDLTVIKFSFDDEEVAGGYTPAPDDRLVCGVPVSFTTNKFFAAGNAGKARFVEGHVLCNGTFGHVRLSFANDNNPNFSKDATAVSGNINAVFRTWVTREACLGRYIQMRVEHDTPFELFNATGASWVYRDLGTFKATRNRI